MRVLLAQIDLIKSRCFKDNIRVLFVQANLAKCCVPANIPHTRSQYGQSPASSTTQLHDLACDLAYWQKHWPDTLEQAVHLHHRAVQIHPFPNGNGRWSRLLATTTAARILAHNE
jgi:hypothetical protein